MAVLPGNPKCTMTSCWMTSLGFVYGLLLGNWEYQTQCPRRNCTPLPILAWTERAASDKIKTRSARIIGNLRTTRKFTTTTYVDWEKTGTRTSVSAGEKKLKMQSVGRLTTTTLNVVRNKVFRNGVFLNNAMQRRWRIFRVVWPFRVEKHLLSVRNYSTFNLNEMTESECLSEFRFRKRDILMW